VLSRVFAAPCLWQPQESSFSFALGLWYAHSHVQKAGRQVRVYAHRLTCSQQKAKSGRLRPLTSVRTWWSGSGCPFSYSSASSRTTRRWLNKQHITATVEYNPWGSVRGSGGGGGGEDGDGAAIFRFALPLPRLRQPCRAVLRCNVAGSLAADVRRWGATTRKAKENDQPPKKPDASTYQRQMRKNKKRDTPKPEQLQLTSTLRPMNRRRIAQPLERRGALVQGERPQPRHAREREAEGVEDTL